MTKRIFGFFSRLLHGEGVRLEVVEFVDHGHRRSVARQRQGLLDGGVAAADGDDVFVGEEVAVAGGAVGDATTLEPCLGREAESARHAAAGDDHGAGGEGSFIVDLYDLLVAGQVDARHVRVPEQLTAELLGLSFHRHGDLASRGFEVTGVVGDGVGQVHLPAQGPTIHDQSAEPGAAEIDPGRQPGGAAAEHDHVVVLGHFRVRGGRRPAPRIPDSGSPSPAAWSEC